MVLAALVVGGGGILAATSLLGGSDDTDEVADDETSATSAPADESAGAGEDGSDAGTPNGETPDDVDAAIVSYVDSLLLPVAFESTDGSAFAGSRTTFTVTDVASGELRVVGVDGTDGEVDASTTIGLPAGTYRIEPAADVQISETGSATVRDLSTTEITVPSIADVSDPTAPVEVVQFGLEVQRSPFDLRVDSVSADAATLVWEAIDGADVAAYDLRLGDGLDAVDRGDGTTVALDSPTATSATIGGLRPAAQYTATLFATDAAGADLPSRSVSITTPSGEPGEPAFVLAPNTILPANFDDLDVRRVGDELVAMNLDAAMPRSSVTDIPGVDPAASAGGCVVGTPVLVSTEVAGDDAFYGVVGSCRAEPAAWRSTAGTDEGESTVALIDTGVPLAKVMPYVSIDDRSFTRCAITGDAAAEQGAGPSEGSPEFCDADDTDGDGMADTTERALGLDPGDPDDNWESRAAATDATVQQQPAIPTGELEAPADLATGPLEITLLWATGDDLDLSVVDADGTTVSARGNDGSGGSLIADDAGDRACASTETNVERVIWTDAPPLGVYSIRAEQFTGVAGSPRDPCSDEVDARLQVRLDGELVIDRVIGVGGSCPRSNGFEITAQGVQQGPDLLVAACSFDGDTGAWRLVSTFEDVDGNGQPSVGDIARFYDYPTTFDENGDGRNFVEIPQADCEMVRFTHPVGQDGPPQLSITGADCTANWKHFDDPAAAQDRFDMDNRRFNPPPAPEDVFDFDMLDMQHWTNGVFDWITLNEETLVGNESEDVRQGPDADQRFLDVEFYFQAAGVNSWRPPAASPATRSPAVTPSRAAVPEIECESGAEVAVRPRFGLDEFHDVDIELKYTQLRWDVEAGVTVYVDPLLATVGTVECGLELPSVSFQLMTTPVPLNLEIGPVITASLEGSFELDGPRLAVTLGIDTTGELNTGTDGCDGAAVFDQECPDGVSSTATAEPISDFTTGGIDGRASGEASLGAGVEISLGVGVKNAFVTAKKGFVLTLEPVKGVVEASATVPIVVDEETIEDVADAVFYDFGAPPYDITRYNQMEDDVIANPQYTTESGAPLIGPATDTGCIGGEAPNQAGNGPTTPRRCYDAVCNDNGLPMLTQLGAPIGHVQCATATCYLGGVTVQVTYGPDLITDCPLDQSGADAMAANAAAAPPPADPSTEESPAAAESNLDDGVCLGVSVRAALEFALRAEFWVLGWGEDWRFPLYDTDVTYPGAELQIPGGCGDDD